MLRRLLLALLVLCLAAPAVAAPVHCAPAQMQEHADHEQAIHGDHADHDDRQPAQPQPSGQKGHDCIGCGVPQFGASSVPDVMPLPAAPLFVSDSALVLGSAARPETPPPRI